MKYVFKGVIKIHKIYSEHWEELVNLYKLFVSSFVSKCYINILFSSSSSIKIGVSKRHRKNLKRAFGTWITGLTNTCVRMVHLHAPRNMK